MRLQQDQNRPTLVIFWKNNSAFIGLIDTYAAFRYFIFTSFWAYKVYFVYGFTLLVIFILIAVTSCVTIVCTYFLLNAEDYRW